MLKIEDLKLRACILMRNFTTFQSFLRNLSKRILRYHIRERCVSLMKGM
jgi:hypothetical protein